MLKINREGLTIKPNGPLEPSEGSYNVSVKLEDDNTYSEYENTMYAGYLVKGIKKTVKCETDSEGNHLIPASAFAQNGPLFISFLLEDKTKNEGLMTNALTYIVKEAPSFNIENIIEPSYNDMIQEWIKEIVGEGSAGVSQETLNQINKNTEDISKLSSEIDSKQPKGDYASASHTHDEYLTEHQYLSSYALKS